MAIAGIEAKYDMRNLLEHPPTYVPHGVELYTAEQVREILIKFAYSVSVSEDWDYSWDETLEFFGSHLMIGGLSIYGDDTMVEAVNDFIKGDNNE